MKFFLLLTVAISTITAHATLTSVKPHIRCDLGDQTYYVVSSGRFIDVDNQTSDVSIITRHNPQNEVLGRVVTPSWCSKEDSKKFTFHYDRLAFGGYANLKIARSGKSYLDIALSNHLEVEGDNYHVTRLNSYMVIDTAKCTWLE